MVERRRISVSPAEENNSINSQERRENLQKYSKFLAGLFETAGLINIYVKANTGRNDDGTPRDPTSSPVITLKDTRREKLERFKYLFGGNVYDTSDKGSFEWRVGGQDAVAIAEHMVPHSVRMRERAMAVFLWGRSSQAQRVNLGIMLKDTGLRYPEVDTYRKKVSDPSFLAGVFEGRGALYGKSQDPMAPDEIHIITQNYGLLQAVQEKNKGSLYREKSGKLRLCLGKESSAGLLGSIVPHMVSPIGFYAKAA